MNDTPTPSDGRRVLLADDEAAVRDFVRTALEAEGFIVDEARNGLEVVRQVTKHTYDVIVTDIVMPEMEGLETIKHLLEVGHRVPIVAISGGFGAPYLRVAKHMGASAIVRKPFTAEEIVRVVHGAITRHLESVR